MIIESEPEDDSRRAVNCRVESPAYATELRGDDTRRAVDCRVESPAYAAELLEYDTNVGNPGSVSESQRSWLNTPRSTHSRSKLILLK